MPSFDVVSEIDMHELTNAVDQANKEVTTRYDFKGTGATFELAGHDVTMTGEAKFQLGQMLDIFRIKLSRRGVDVNCMDVQSAEESGLKVKQKIIIKEGLDSESAKKITKLIKEKKLKVQAQIQKEQVRVTGKKRDDLQAVMAMLKGESLGIPLQYKNFRD
ncbi:MAG: YajQ family cyclic di-GMP-binding protein [Cycloclasticus sp. symbiont of Bathymodiolus heckerae]|nr:MAG: YajQ family cyclic di-GMP-binding protein [Cycloclasticus sp. symbiont of Bathymodiolus heckerae]